MWKPICVGCHCELPLRIATANCRCELLLRTATANCHCELPLRIAAASCLCELQALLENSSVAFHKTSAAHHKSSAAFLKPFANCLQDSPRNLRVRLWALQVSKTQGAVLQGAVFCTFEYAKPCCRALESHVVFSKVLQFQGFAVPRFRNAVVLKRRCFKAPLF